MSNSKSMSPQCAWRLWLASSTVLGVWFSGLAPAWSLTAPPVAQRLQPQHPLLAQARPDFSDAGRPRRRQGGGSRGTCLIADQPPLTALMPASSTGFTLAKSPSFWFYLPYDLDDRHKLEFVLKDAQDNLVHRKVIAGQDSAPGIINLRLPETLTLETNQTYEWYLLVYCDAANPERFVFVNGAIHRLDRPDLQQQLATLSAAAQTDLYQSENLWYDTLDSIAVQLRSAPPNASTPAQWTELLDSIDLTHLAAEPLVSCCTTDP